MMAKRKKKSAVSRSLLAEKEAVPEVVFIPPEESDVPSPFDPTEIIIDTPPASPEPPAPVAVEKVPFDIMTATPEEVFQFKKLKYL